MNKYIHKRPNGTYQVRIYSNQHSFSFSSEDLNECVINRNEYLGYDPDVEPEWEEPEREEDGPKICFLDIETTPAQVLVFRVWQQNIYPEQIIKDWQILCFAWKFEGEEGANFIGQNGFTEYELLEYLWDLLDQADIVVTHNGKMFDHKKINAKFLEYNFTPPSVYKVFDTLKILRAKFGFLYNKQDYVSKKLGGNGKFKHSGIDLWVRCMEGDYLAWAEMEEYNIQDIADLENMYHALRPWDSRGPSVATFYTDNFLRCTACGKTDVVQDGFIHTKVHRYKRWYCADCGHEMRETKNNSIKRDIKLVSAE